MQNDTLVEVKNVSRWYGSNCAVNNISFQVKRGEVLGFLGPNGAGKSTTMNMVTGNLAPMAGEIFVNGIDLLEQPQDAKAHIGFLPEQPPLYKAFTVDEYLRFCARINRVTKTAIASAMDTAKQRCGLTQIGKRLIGNLSKGYQQRVAIAQAIIHSPNVVILDEPTVGLDPIQINEIRQLIRELGDEHSVILSSHILPEIQTTCDRVQIINQGELVYHSSLKNLEQTHPVDCLLASFKKPPTAKELEELHQVESVELVDNHQFKIFFDPDDSPAETIVQASVANHWSLTELTPQQKTLEQIFVDIISSDSASKQFESSGPYDEDRAA
jgi:ABC-2 type transport system ATP-binding protein